MHTPSVFHLGRFRGFFYSLCKCIFIYLNIPQDNNNLFLPYFYVSNSALFLLITTVLSLSTDVVLTFSIELVSNGIVEITVSPPPPPAVYEQLRKISFNKYINSHRFLLLHENIICMTNPSSHDFFYLYVDALRVGCYSKVMCHNQCIGAFVLNSLLCMNDCWMWV